MNPYLTHTEIREFEDKIGYKKIIDSNIIIGKYLDFKPEVEWMVGNEEGSCFHPKSLGYNDELGQKLYAEKWLKEQHEKYPEGWVVKEGNKVIKREYYPDFHQDWNHLIEAVRKYQKKCGFNLIFNYEDDFTTFQIWHSLVDSIKYKENKI
jgi:hypothetical protein